MAAVGIARGGNRITTTIDATGLSVLSRLLFPLLLVSWLRLRRIPRQTIRSVANPARSAAHRAAPDTVPIRGGVLSIIM